MTLKEIRVKAKTLGIKNYSKLNKDVLIRQIQQAEGNSPCFKTIENCGEMNCAWRDDCQS
ncbi:MAG: Rho termination factor N-terminal domain-containing protein [Desulfomonilaceae bacterium]